MAYYVTYSNMCCQKLFKYLTHPTILSSCFLTSACSTCSSCIFFSKKARCFSSLLCQRKSDCQNQLTIRGLIKVELAVYNTTHKSVNYDRSGECRTEKDCLRWHWLTFRQPERKSSSESDDDVRSGCRNVSQCHHKRSFLGLHSPGRS